MASRAKGPSTETKDVVAQVLRNARMGEATRNRKSEVRAASQSRRYALNKKQRAAERSARDSRGNNDDLGGILTGALESAGEGLMTAIDLPRRAVMGATMGLAATGAEALGALGIKDYKTDIWGKAEAALGGDYRGQNFLQDVGLDGDIAKWGGLAVDILSDPITYVAPQAALAGGAKAGARTLEQANVALRGARAAEETSHAAAAFAKSGLRGGAEARAGVAARDAARAATRAERQEVMALLRKPGGFSNLSKEQLAKHFGATGGAKFTIPGTGRWAKKLHSPLARKGPVQAPFIPRAVTSKLMKPLSKMSGKALQSEKAASLFNKFASADEDAQLYRNMARSGEGETAAMGVSGEVGRQTSQAIVGKRINLRNDEYTQVVEPLLRGRHEEVVRAVETGDMTVKGAKELSKWFDNLADDAEEFGMQMDEIEQYYPRMTSDAVRKRGKYAPTAPRTKRGDPAEIRDTMNALAREQGMGEKYYIDHPDLVIPDYLQAMRGRMVKARTMEHLGRGGHISLSGSKGAKLAEAVADPDGFRAALQALGGDAQRALGAGGGNEDLAARFAGVGGDPQLALGAGPDAPLALGAGKPQLALERGQSAVRPMGTSDRGPWLDPFAQGPGVSGGAYSHGAESPLTPYPDTPLSEINLDEVARGSHQGVQDDLEKLHGANWKIEGIKGNPTERAVAARKMTSEERIASGVYIPAKRGLKGGKGWELNPEIFGNTKTIRAKQANAFLDDVVKEAKLRPYAGSVVKEAKAAKSKGTLAQVRTTLLENEAYQQARGANYAPGTAEDLTLAKRARDEIDAHLKQLDEAAGRSVSDPALNANATDIMQPQRASDVPEAYRQPHEVGQGNEPALAAQRNGYADPKRRFFSEDNGVIQPLPDGTYNVRGLEHLTTASDKTILPDALNTRFVKQGGDSSPWNTFGPGSSGPGAEIPGGMDLKALRAKLTEFIVDTTAQTGGSVRTLGTVDESTKNMLDALAGKTRINALTGAADPTYKAGTYNAINDIPEAARPIAARTMSANARSEALDAIEASNLPPEIGREVIGEDPVGSVKKIFDEFAVNTNGSVDGEGTVFVVYEGNLNQPAAGQAWTEEGGSALVKRQKRAKGDLYSVQDPKGGPGSTQQVVGNDALVFDPKLHTAKKIEDLIHENFTLDIDTPEVYVDQLKAIGVQDEAVRSNTELAKGSSRTARDASIVKRTPNAAARAERAAVKYTAAADAAATESRNLREALYNQARDEGLLRPTGAVPGEELSKGTTNYEYLKSQSSPHEAQLLDTANVLAARYHVPREEILNVERNVARTGEAAANARVVELPGSAGFQVIEHMPDGNIQALSEPFATSLEATKRLDTLRQAGHTRVVGTQYSLNLDRITELHYAEVVKQQADPWNLVDAGGPPMLLEHNPSIHPTLDAPQLALPPGRNAPLALPPGPRSPLALPAGPGAPKAIESGKNLWSSTNILPWTDAHTAKALGQRPAALQGAEEAVRQRIQVAGEHLNRLMGAGGSAKEAANVQSVITHETQAADLLGRAAQETDPAMAHAATLEAQASMAEAQLAREGRAAANPSLNKVRVSAFGEALDDGIKQNLGAIGRPDLQAHPDLADILTRVAEARTPAGAGKFLKHYDQLLNFTKSWQIATPGFHTRNFMGGAFNNWLADMDVGAYRRFLSARKEWRAVTSNGTLPLDLEKASANVKAYDTWYAVDTGKGQFGLNEIRTGAHHGGPSFNPFKADNLLTTTSQKAGGSVEELLRGSLGMDRLLKGKSLDAALDDVYKFHFDYNALSDFERTRVKRVIPFYTWTRKNFPLQLEMMAKSPGKYNNAMKVRETISSEQRDIMPSWFADSWASPLAAVTGDIPLIGSGNDQLFMTPDLPFTRTMTDSLPLGPNGLDFKRPLNQITPLIKVPLELMAGKKAFGGAPDPFKNDRVVGGAGMGVRGGLDNIPFLMDLLKGAGIATTQTKNDKYGRWHKGDTMLDERFAYTLESAIPWLAQVQRLTPASPTKQDHALASALSYLGIPIRANTKKDQALAKYLGGRTP